MLHAVSAADYLLGRFTKGNITMDYLGLFSLGAFVGAIATFGLRFMKDAQTWKQGLFVMIAATLSGTAILFVDRFRNSEALGAYPLGLLISLMWAYADVAIANIKSDGKPSRIVGWLHLIGVTLASLIAAALVLPPAVRKAWSDFLNASQ